MFEISSLSIYDSTDKIGKPEKHQIYFCSKNTNYYYIFSLFYFTLSHFLYLLHTNNLSSEGSSSSLILLCFEYKHVHVVVFDYVVMLIVYTCCSPYYAFEANVMQWKRQKFDWSMEGWKIKCVCCMRNEGFWFRWLENACLFLFLWFTIE